MHRRPPLDDLIVNRSKRPASVRVTPGVSHAVRPVWRAALAANRHASGTRRHRKAIAKLRRHLS